MQSRRTLGALLILFALTSPAVAVQRSGRITDLDLRNVENRKNEWLTHGRDYGEARFSPLKEINANNVGQLGLAWAFDAETTRGLEATPIVVGGRIFTTGAWSVVYAIDARTGRQIWKWDPEVPRRFGQKACCDVVNRGVAVYEGLVFVGTLDGRLVALNADTGKVLWQVVTVDQSKPYTITGAPRVLKGNVIIGNGGAEFGVRGYVSAYNARTGKLAWRFYTVPGDPLKPFESPDLEKAAKTWKGEWWKYGGGGTVWDSMAYDPVLDLLYIGTGNGSPWNREIRSPGGGDNLYLSSIVALRPSTGRVVWHYQTTPGDTWDFTATQHILLADLTIGGTVRKVLMQAPKNGFFYVLDRRTGELISADPYVRINWATGVDLKTGRPIEAASARYQKQLEVISPGPLGGHNWQPMSFNPVTGLVYVPAQEPYFAYMNDSSFRYRPGAWNTGIEFGVFKDPPDPKLPPILGHLLAWDPVARKERWRVPYGGIWNGGTLTTAGNLVFQGTADGRFVAYSADKGEKLWEFKVGTGIVAAPVTWSLDGKQYVSVMAGWGGAHVLSGGFVIGGGQPSGRLLTFALNGKTSLPTTATARLAQPGAIRFNATPERIDRGAILFARWCGVCHGLAATGGGGAIKDLRYSSPATFERMNKIVLEGEYESVGMPSFKEWLTTDDVEALRVYLLKRRADLINGKP